MATATHGTSSCVGGLQTMVESLTLVDGTGAVRHFSKGRDEEFDGVVVHLGALGVITEVTLNVVDDFNVHESVELLSFEQWTTQAAQIVNDTKYVKFWLELYTGRVIVYRTVPSTGKPRGSPPRWLSDLRVYLLTLLQTVGGRVPGGANAVMWLTMKNWPIVDRVAPHEQVFNIPHAIPRLFFCVFFFKKKQFLLKSFYKI